MGVSRRASGDPYGVGHLADTGAAATVERTLDLIVESTESVPDPPEGVRDRRRAATQALMERLGVDAADFAATYDIGRDYQHDHPLCRVDRTLDDAFMPDGSTPDLIRAVAPVVDGLVASRLATYATRAAARARMTGDPQLVRSAMRAHALALVGRSEADARDDMVALAPIVVAAREFACDGDPLGTLARLLPAAGAAVVRRFAARADVTLAAFGWTELRTPHGVWIVPAQSDWETSGDPG